MFIFTRVCSDAEFWNFGQMFEAITWFKKKNSILILVGTTYWSGLIEWIKTVLIEQEKPWVLMI
jgi:predicted Rossmann-fold nucleotide-binding protein